ncbi:MAG: GNAT family N-acetyltransferase [Lactobacillus sp.]|jgi:L-amino acid N-acyltransferase YncA|nr:GNAT family N-acetyltransferase [Lactobacillus sp.]MCH4068360.1 GNAT family N-acetyltransferase [Lactobacillus sp.]MCI1304373.1 GNAT family N-acetyltransferase [Lactobacillus sp.]MCI1330359.1 GNAT family N-acetyltransferase [Lactobacillus sp.]MCI1359132.1 GNAT family N-acetyltransferase [Lactobacillus sp.]
MSLIYARQACPADVPAIVEILKAAIAFLKASGSTQWQSGYPNQQTVEKDLRQGSAYVLEVQGQIAGYAAVVTGEDPHYRKIQGAWHNTTDQYATIHRLALSPNFRGQHLASYFLSDLISIKYSQCIANFRVDTFKKNLAMQHVATSQGFVKCGIIQVDDPIDSARFAYELNLQQP